MGLAHLQVDLFKLTASMVKRALQVQTTRYLEDNFMRTGTAESTLKYVLIHNETNYLEAFRGGNEKLTVLEVVHQIELVFMVVIIGVIAPADETRVLVDWN